MKKLIEQIMSERLSELEGREFPTGIHRVSSGSLILDKAIGGGYPIQGLTLIIGEPGSYKTWLLALAIEACVHRGQRPDFVSLIHPLDIVLSDAAIKECTQTAARRIEDIEELSNEKTALLAIDGLHAIGTGDPLTAWGERQRFITELHLRLPPYAPTLLTLTYQNFEDVERNLQNWPVPKAGFRFDLALNLYALRRSVEVAVLVNRNGILRKASLPLTADGRLDLEQDLKDAFNLTTEEMREINKAGQLERYRKLAEDAYKKETA